MQEEEKDLFKKLKIFVSSKEGQKKISKIVLATLGIATLMSAIIVAPTAVAVVGGLFGNKKYTRKKLSSAINGLRHQKLIEYIKDKNNQTIVRITTKGKSRLRAFAIEAMEIPEPRRWDGKWRAVIFDIPVRFRKGREGLRHKIKDMDFFQLQKSIWVHPYPCEDEIIFVADFFGVGKYVEILTIESLLHARKLHKHFSI